MREFPPKRGNSNAASRPKWETVAANACDPEKILKSFNIEATALRWRCEPLRLSCDFRYPLRALLATGLRMENRAFQSQRRRKCRNRFASGAVDKGGQSSGVLHFTPSLSSYPYCDIIEQVGQSHAIFLQLIT